MKEEVAFDNYQQKEREKNKTAEIFEVTKIFIYKEGSLLSSAKEKIMLMVEKVNKIYPKDVEKQLQLLHFHIEDYIGKRTQIFIYQRPALEGHCLYTNSNVFIELEYGNFMYVIWQSNLFEDREDFKSF